MAEYPIMQFSTDAFIADTVHLDAAATGAYLMLLLCAWRSENCTLPDDDKKLARMARCDTKTWRRIRDDVMAFWDLHDGQWSQKRLLKERRRADDLRKERSRAAKVKWLKYNKPGDASAEQLQCKGNANQEPRTRKEKDTLRVSKKKRGSRIPESWEPDRDYAAAKGLSPVQIEAEAEKFRNYWRAKPGQGGVKLDWAATWRNWVLSAVERQGRAPPGRGDGVSVSEAIADIAADMGVLGNG